MMGARPSAVDNIDVFGSDLEACHQVKVKGRRRRRRWHVSKVDFRTIDPARWHVTYREYNLFTRRLRKNKSVLAPSGRTCERETKVMDPPRFFPPAGHR